MSTATKKKPTKTKKKKVTLPRSKRKVKFEEVKGGCNTTVLGRTYFLQAVEVPFENAEPDGLNPRYTQDILARKNKPLSQDEIFDLLKGDDDTYDLKKSIEQNGGLIVPVLFLPDGKTIWDGNRRWAAYKLLREDNPTQWGVLRGYLIPDSVPSPARRIIRGVEHIEVSKKYWAAYAQSFDVVSLHKDGLSIEDIADAYGCPIVRIRMIIETNKWSTEILKVPGNKNPRFSQCFEALKSQSVRDAAKIPAKRAVMVKAIAAGKFKTNKEARLLGKIAEDDKALDALAKTKGPKAVEKAVKIVTRNKPNSLGVFRKLSRCTVAITNSRSAIVKQLKSDDGEESQDTVQELLTVLLKVCEKADRKDIIRKAKRDV